MKQIICRVGKGGRRPPCPRWRRWWARRAKRAPLPTLRLVRY